MSISTNKTKITNVTFDEQKIYIVLSSGDILTLPYTYTSKIANADKEDLKSYYIIGDGIGIHFEKIDEDISLNGILRYKINHELLAS